MRAHPGLLLATLLGCGSSTNPFAGSFVTNTTITLTSGASTASFVFTGLSWQQVNGYSADQVELAASGQTTSTDSTTTSVVTTFSCNPIGAVSGSNVSYAPPGADCTLDTITSSVQNPSNQTIADRQLTIDSGAGQSVGGKLSLTLSGSFNEIDTLPGGSQTNSSGTFVLTSISN
jgi:hypothetical protein